MNKDQKVSFLFSLWSIQNSVLQSLRVIFIGVGTVVLSLATVLALSDKHYYLVLVLCPLGIFISLRWRIICKDRGYDDSYLRGQILRLENGEHISDEVLTDFREWQSKTQREKRDELAARNGTSLVLPSKTRIFVDNHLPLVFLACWMLLLLSLVLRVSGVCI